MKYVIYNMDNISSLDFSKVLEESIETLRYSLNREETILKFQGETPEFLLGLETYTNEEILTILRNPENGWVSNDD